MGTAAFRKTFYLSKQNTMFSLQKTLKGYTKGILFLISVRFHFWACGPDLGNV